MVLNKIKNRIFGKDEERNQDVVDTRDLAGADPTEADPFSEKSKRPPEKTVRERIIEVGEQKEALDREDRKSGSHTKGGPYADLLDKMEFHNEEIVKEGDVEARIPIGGAMVFPVKKEDGTWAVHRFKLGRRLKMDEVVLIDTIMNDLHRSPLLGEAKKTGEFRTLIREWVNKGREKMDLPIPTWQGERTHDDP